MGRLGEWRLGWVVIGWGGGCGDDFFVAFYGVFVVISDQTGSSGAVNKRFLKCDGVTP